MYHLHFKGTHYDIGERFGLALAKRGKNIIDNVPFPITKEREDFARLCVPIYKKFFPEILEEIRGLAEGQNCELNILQAVLFSMYAIPPMCNCSCFAVSNEKNIFLGRNSDFLTKLEKLNMNTIYNFSNDSYNFTGNTTAFIEMEDGVNENGLAVGLTSVYPTKIRYGFNAGMLVRFFIEKCRNVEEVIKYIKHLPISSAQTITAADAKGDIAVIECNSEKVNIVRHTNERKFVCATNIFCSKEMLSLQNLNIDNWQADERYNTLFNTLSNNYYKMDVKYAQNLLSGKYGFLCQYDRNTKKDTVWSVIYDLKHKSIYRAEGNPIRKSFIKDSRFVLNYF